jgi:S-adenosylmethionine:tRNA ribosyltransferase-isomerase
MLVSDFHYDLPEDLIAQHPPAVRGSSRMMALDRRTGAFTDRSFTHLPALLQPGDLLVLNDSRVLPARLYATRGGLTTQANSPQPTGLVEVLLTQHLPGPEGHNDWSALVKPAKKVQPGEALHFVSPERSTLDPGPALRATVLSAGDYGERTLRFDPTGDFHAALERIGHLPLPPYIHREKNRADTAEDRERYQTIYSTPLPQQTPSGPRTPDPGPSGSAAAPTAGLHFTPEILKHLEVRGVELARVTLHVGLGTFQPIRAERTEEIHLHAEPYSLSEATADALNRATKESRRVIAVGTTTTRTLEHIARITPAGQSFQPHSGSTSLFLSPGLNDDFELVQGLLTNFHLPSSTLLMLVSAFAGREAVLRAYTHAIEARYRFFSYGDCMLIS